MTDHSLEQALRAVIAEETGRDLGSVGLDEPLRERLALDSLAGLRVMAAIEETFDVEFDVHRLAGLDSLRAILAAIDAFQGGAP